MFGREIMIRMGRRAGIALCVLLAACPRAFALNPALDVSQLAHTAWRIRDGFAKGTITSIAQTPDGYLWLGTEFGVLRFDGVTFAPWKPPPGQFLPSNSISSLLAGRDGTLWLGTSQGLASWNNWKLTEYAELAGQTIRAPILESRDGTVWAGGLAFPPPGKLCAIQKGSVRCYGEDGVLGNGVRGLYEDRGRNLWVGVQDGLWQWKPSPPKFYPESGSGNGIEGLAETVDGSLLFGPRTGVKRLVGGKIEAYSLPGAGQQFTATLLLRDGDGNLWIGTSDGGLVHVHQDRTDVFRQADGLSGDLITALFIDREGDIWVATNGGLDRFRELAVSTLSLNQGLSNASVLSVLADRDGSVWLSSRRGLNRWNKGRITLFGDSSAHGLLNGNYAGSLFQDHHGRVWASTLREFGYLEKNQFVSLENVPGGPVYSVAEDARGNLWIANKDLGLISLFPGGHVQQIPWAALGHQDYGKALAVDPVQNGLWVGFYQGGMVHFAAGKVHASYSAADGLGEGRVNDLRFASDGTLWAATEGGLSRLKNGRIATLSTANGLPCDSTHWVMEDDARSFWLYTTCGLLRIVRSELDAWAAAVDKDKDAKPVVHATVLDNSDGVRTIEDYGGYTPQVAKSTDGKLWFLPSDGASIVDPRHLPFNRFPPPVRIEHLIADGTMHGWGVAFRGRLRLPPPARYLQIGYWALSLVTPEKVRFRYKLEGFDRDWHNAGTRRLAFYTSLPPGNYRFRLSACNNSGVWNEAGDTLDFLIVPAYYQTLWFRAFCVAAFLVLLWGLYRIRLRRIQHEFGTRMEERTRIARELHDTLLQTFHGLMLRLQVVDELLPPGRAKEELEQTLDCADQAIIESRNAVHDLRSSAMTTNDLARSLRALGDELASGNAATFRLVVEGQARDLNPIVRDEFYRIAREALRNAFRHARANHIEAEIIYAAGLLRLRIRDDGEGIPPKILEQGRSGHYGLPGMRERARQIGSKVRIWSGMGAGTEIDLSIAGSIAYNKAGRSRLRLFRKKVG